MKNKLRNQMIEVAREWILANNRHKNCSLERFEAISMSIADFHLAQESRLIQLLTDIRFALGDDGKRMQDELVEYCKEVRAERDRLRGFINGLTGAHWEWATIRKMSSDRGILLQTDADDQIFKTPLEAVEAYLNSKAGSGENLTKDDLAKMTPAEIAKLDWADVRRTLAKD